jgi:hypothetical protein
VLGGIFKCQIVVVTIIIKNIVAQNASMNVSVGARHVVIYAHGIVIGV